MKRIVLFERLVQGFQYPEIFQALYDGYAAATERPSQAEQDELAQLLREHDDTGLRLWLTSCRGDREEMAHRLSALPEDDYRHFVRSVLRQHLVRPAQLVVPGRGNTVVQAVVDGGLADDWALPELIEQLIASEEQTSVTALIPVLHQQQPRTLRRLTSLVGQHRQGLPERFVEAVSEAAKGAPRKRVSGFLRLLVRRHGTPGE
jgi:hypothetical protein